MKKRTAVREVLEQAATLPTQYKQHKYLSEAVKEDEQYVADQTNDPDSLLLKLNEVYKKGELEWFSLPDSLILATAESGSGMGWSGYSAPIDRTSDYSPSTAKGYERPAWKEIEDRVAFVTSIRRKVECLENFLACDKEHVNEGLLESLEAKQGKTPFRVKLRLGVAYLRACEKADIPPLLKVSTIVRNPSDVLLSSSISEDVRAETIALAKKERKRVYRRIAEEALQELRQRYKEKQSKSGWLHALQRLRLGGTASSFCCGDALLELISEELRKHPDNRPGSTELGRTGGSPSSRQTLARGSAKEDSGPKAGEVDSSVGLGDKQKEREQPQGVREEKNKEVGHRWAKEIGTALEHNYKRHGHYDYQPDYPAPLKVFHGSKETFKKWASEVISDAGDYPSPSKVYEVLKEEGLYVKDNQGASSGLRSTVANLLWYARKHRSS